MTNRERFLAVLNGKPRERMPMIEWATWWNLTVDEWKKEGLDTNGQELFQYWGLDALYQYWIPGEGPGCPGPAAYGEGIIKNEADYERILPYLYQDASIEAMCRWAQNMKERHDRGDCVVWWTFDGFFWYPRKLFGIEPHLYAFYDEPDLMHRINRDLAEFCVRITRAVAPILAPEYMTIAEDMSYNHGPMLSKDLFDEFLAPYYQIVVPELKKFGIHVMVDTDGFVEPMIPWLEEVGVEGCLPLERQAGVDESRIRANHPNWIMIGGYDKTIMHLGEEAMRREFERLLPVMKTGRFIASVDHQTPPDVTMENYRTYLKLLNEYSRKAAED